LNKKYIAFFLLFFLAIGLYIINVGNISNISNLFSKNDLISDVKLEIVSRNGTVVQTLEQKNPLSIVAIFGSKSYDITYYFNAYDSIYYFRITPYVKSIFNATGPTKIVYEVTWDSVVYAGNKVNAFYYSPTTITGQQVSFGSKKVIEISNPQSGQSVALNDAIIVIPITQVLIAPPVGSSYDLKGSLTVTATLYVNGVAQSPSLKQTGTFTITIKNMPDGTLSAIDITFDIGNLQYQYLLYPY